MASEQRPPMPTDFFWASICSMHHEYNASCGLCSKGRWIYREQHDLEQWLFRRNRRLWREWANRTESPSRTFLEKIFPGLRRKTVSEVSDGK
jgi:hypothetical protein